MNEFLVAVCGQLHFLMKPAELVAPAILACDASLMLEKMSAAANAYDIMTAIADFPLVDPPRLFLA
jgi:hypothetical protein